MTDKTYVLILTALIIGFISGATLNDPDYNPYKNPSETTYKTADNKTQALENVGWGVQQEKEAAALHNGFIKGVTTDQEKEYFKFLNENQVPRDWHREEHHYKIIGFTAGNTVYHINSFFWYLKTPFSHLN